MVLHHVRGGGTSDYADVVWYSALAYLVLLTLLAYLDRRRPEAVGEPPAGAGRLRRVPWVDLGILVIGAMMCIQVFADMQVGWYNTDGYAELTRSYAQTTGAPGWWSSFLDLVADNASLFMPLQAVAEFGCALFLAMLLLRPASLLAIFGFFFTLMFSEFGVSATIKVGGDKTWEWEMLFLVGVTLMLAVITLARALQLRGWRRRALGDRFYLRFPLWGQVLAAFLGAGLLWWVGFQTKMFGSGYLTISWRGAAFLGLCLLGLIVVDRYRDPATLEDRAARIWVR